MGLWKNLGKVADSKREPRGVSQAALAGASLEELCQEAYWTVQHALHGKADRFGVWLDPHSALNAPSDSEPFQGRFWDVGRVDSSTEWNALGSHFAVPAALAQGLTSITEQFDTSRSEFLSGPAARMRRALWVPICADVQLHGALFVASHSPTAQFPLADLQRVAADLALALSFRFATVSGHRHAADLAAARKILVKICSGSSSEAILQEITDDSFRVVNQRKLPSQFAALGFVPAANTNPSSSDPPIEFRCSAGDHLASRSVTSDTTSDIWRQALHTKTVVGREWQHPGPRSAAIRIVALPLLIADAAAGVLVVGMHSASASFATLVRLELRAHLASVALRLSLHPPLAGTAEVSNFFLQNSSEPVVQLNATQEIVSANPAAAELLPPPSPASGLRHSSPHGVASSPVPVSRLFRPADWLRVSAWLQRVAESGAPCEAQALSVELRVGRQARLHAFPVAPSGLFLLLRDAVRSAESVAASEALQLRSLLEWIDQGVLLFDERQSLRAANQRFSQLFGLSPEEMKRATGLRDLVGLIAPGVSDPDRFADSWWDAARGVEAAAPEELRILQPAPRVIERVSRPIRNSAGISLGHIEIYTDLSPQQLSRARLHKMERLAALGQNVSGVAHELSNPLTTIVGYAERVLRNPGNNDHRGEIQRIFSEAERAVSILRQLLASARESPSPRHPVDLNPVILRTVELDRLQMASENIHLHPALSPSLPRILGDPGQLQQILMNLISNARHALLEQKRPGTIFVRTFVNQFARVVLEVSDTGPGIPEAHRYHIFDPFFTTKAPGIGTGLGLSIVMGLVRQNDGNIRMQSPPGKGATFLIDFPAVKAEVPIPVQELPAALSVIPPLSATGRALVVEDELTVAQLIADMLADLGFAPDVQQDSRRALVSALNRDYALIICDMKMPVLDGQHFYRALAEAGSPLASKFLFVTGDVLGLATQEFLRKHRLPYIAKPFRLEEFSEKVAAVVNQESNTSSSLQLQAHDLSLKNLHSHG